MIADDMDADLAELKSTLNRNLEAAADFLRDQIQQEILGDGLVRTGRLLHSVQSSEQGWGRATVFSDCPYLVYQDQGTSRGVRGRHFWDSTIDASEAAVERIIFDI